MTYWLYNPNTLVSTRSVIPTKSQDAGDVLNFLTLNMIFLFCYLKKINSFEKYSKYYMYAMVTIIFMGILFGSPRKSQDNYLKYNDYKYSLSID